MPYNVHLIVCQVEFSLSFDMPYVGKSDTCVHAHMIKRQEDIKIRPEDRFTVKKDYEGKRNKKASTAGVLTNERLSTLVVPLGLLCAIKDFQQGRLL